MKDLLAGAAPPATSEERATRPALSAAGAWTAPVAPPGIWRILALVLSDAIAVLTAGMSASLLTTWGSPSPGAWVRVASIVPLFSLSYAMGGLYPGFGVSAIQLLRSLSRHTSLIFLVIGGSNYALRPLGDAPVAMFAWWWGAALLIVPLMRVQVSSVAAAREWWREPVVLFGCAERLPSVIASLGNARHLGYRPVAVVLTSGHLERRASATWRDLPVITERDSIRAARALRVRTVLLAGMPAPEHKAADLRQHFRHVIIVNSLESPLIEPTAVRYLGSAIGIEYRNGLLMRRNQGVKRLIDVILSALALVMLFPIAALAAGVIVVCSPGPWWHVQRREGRGGIPFRMWKLRTMFPDAEQRLAAHLASDPAAFAEWQKEFKLSRDPRVIPVVGQFLRRWSLDEYPQFWNVIRGDMSLVGPRALPTYHLDAFAPEFRALRAYVRPGMTGMWQVMSRGRGAIRTQEAHDRYYIYNWSIWMDAFVLARTVLAVLTRRGAR